ncbi:MAG TPA: hypothetical protein VJ870_03035 [Amycolatopsis sp.]|nr:hypothetical protein [Amycolatopsis sp.]
MHANLRTQQNASHPEARGNLQRAGIPYTFADDGDGSTWAEGCTGSTRSCPG